jgi:uncharacterized membrane protein
LRLQVPLVLGEGEFVVLARIGGQVVEAELLLGEGCSGGADGDGGAGLAGRVDVVRILVGLLRSESGIPGQLSQLRKVFFFQQICNSQL